MLSIGPGEASRIYKTVDGGASWALQFRNTDPKAFYDAMSFWSERRGLAVSDSVDGRFVVLMTEDGGAHWERVAGERLPAALPGEGAYAASGSNIAVWGDRHAWIGTSAGRVLRTADGGKTWAVAGTGVASSASAGIFSVAFRDARHGVVVGGDYKYEDRAVDNAAVTEDGGATWRLVKGLAGFRSVVTWLPRGGGLLAVGPSGADLSRDGGRTWAAVVGPGFHAFSAGRGARVGFGVSAFAEAMADKGEGTYWPFGVVSAIGFEAAERRAWGGGRHGVELGSKLQNRGAAGVAWRAGRGDWVRNCKSGGR